MSVIQGPERRHVCHNAGNPIQGMDTHVKCLSTVFVGWVADKRAEWAYHRGPFGVQADTLCSHEVRLKLEWHSKWNIVTHLELFLADYL